MANMKTNSMTVTLARVARDIEKWHGGIIEKDRLITLLSEYGVNQEAVAYIGKMLDWGYLYYDHTTDTYHLTEAGGQTVTITITAPRLNSKETRRYLVEKLKGFDEIITVGEVEL